MVIKVTFDPLSQNQLPSREEETLCPQNTSRKEKAWLLLVIFEVAGVLVLGSLLRKSPHHHPHGTLSCSRACTAKSRSLKGVMDATLALSGARSVLFQSPLPAPGVKWMLNERL